VTRPSYDPMRAPAPRFPRGRFARVHDDDTVNALAEAYEALSYEERVSFAHRVTAAPDERLRDIADELAQADQGQPPTEPVPAGAPDAPAVNQTAAQVNPDATPPPPGTPAEGVAAGEPAPTAQPAPAGDAAPTPPPLPPPDQLPQLKVPELQAVAEQVGVAKSGTKQELVDRITAATGEQAVVTPEQVAADAAQQPAGDTTAQPAEATADATAQDPAANAGPGQPAPGPTDATSAPQSAPDTAPGPDTPAAAPAPADGTQTAPQTPAAPADGTTTDGGQTNA
jgi:nicotinate-nucleotide--dimethylbenzimidazole phosphoribosyltransferase